MVSVTSLLPKGQDIDDQALQTWLQAIAAERGVDDGALIAAAVEEARRLHGDEREPSGEQTLLHLLFVADILNGLKLDAETIAAAVLHDAVSCIGYDESHIEKRFGKAVLQMLRNMARLGAVAEGKATGATEDEHIESLRRMLLGIADDVRVLMILLAERVHVMRTLKHQPAEVQRRTARETRDIYAPLANRLGIWHLKWELEDMALRYLEPESYKALARQLDGRRADREHYIREVIDLLKRKCRELDIEAEISGRPKHIYSIWKKMQRKGVGFEQIFDVLAVRVLVDSVAECYEVLGIVHGLWRHIPGEFDDYIATPKANRYRSLHTAVFGPEDKPLEVQIRTYEMHDHAERGVAAHWRYKENRGHDEELERRIAWMRQWLEAKEGASDSEGREQLHAEFDARQIYVLSPQGKVIELPQGATPVDFAYAIHTDIGHRCRGAKVDGRIVPLNYKLESAQTVEILTVKEGGPSRDWMSSHLGYLKTSRARSRVRLWFKHQDYEQHVAIGRASLDRELSRLGVQRPDLDKIAPRFNVNSGEDVLAAIGSGDISPVAVAGYSQRKQTELPLEHPTAAPARKRGHKSAEKKQPESQVMVEGVGDLMTQMARCCKPVPFDPIVGYITRGRGVTVHRRDCSVVRKMNDESRQRLIDVNWTDTPGDAIYVVDVLVHAGDRKGLLRDISAVMAAEEIDVLGVKTSSNRRTDQASMRFTVEINDMHQLSRLMDKISHVPDVTDVRRQS